MTNLIDKKILLICSLLLAGGLVVFFIFDDASEDRSSSPVKRKHDDAFLDSDHVEEMRSDAFGYREEHDQRLLIKYGPDFIENIRSKLNDDETLFDALSTIRTHRIYTFSSELESMLYSNDSRLQRFVAGTLLEFNEDSGYEFLIDTLKSGASFEWYALYSAFLKNERNDFIPSLREVSQGDTEGSVLAYRILAALGEDIDFVEIVDGIIDGFLPNLVAEALIESRDDAAIRYLARVFEEGRGVNEKLNAAWALTSLGQDEYIDFLYQVAGKAREVPSASLIAQDELKGEYTTTSTIYRNWVHENYRLNEITKAVDFLVDVDQDNIVELLGQIAEIQSTKQPVLTSHAIENLAKIGSDSAKRALLGLYSKSPEIRDSVTKALVLFEGDEVEKILVETYSAKVLEDLRFEVANLGWNGIYRKPNFY